MSIKSFLILPFFMLALGVAPVNAETSTDGVLSQKEITAAKELMDTSRNIALIINLDFTAEENDKFWPLYEEYRQKIRGVRARELLLIDEYAGRLRDDTVDDEPQLGQDDSWAAGSGSVWIDRPHKEDDDPVKHRINACSACPRRVGRQTMAFLPARAGTRGCLPG